MDRAFAHAAPILWNSLPLTIRTSSSQAIYKKQLKAKESFVIVLARNKLIIIIIIIIIIFIE